MQRLPDIINNPHHHAYVIGTNNELLALVEFTAPSTTSYSQLPMR
ncbi:hypothetical protein ACOBV8_18525 (plasmid) [Pseudoalteromonas espejiana]